MSDRRRWCWIHLECQPHKLTYQSKHPCSILTTENARSVDNTELIKAVLHASGNLAGAGAACIWSGALLVIRNFKRRYREGGPDQALIEINTLFWVRVDQDTLKDSETPRLSLLKPRPLWCHQRTQAIVFELFLALTGGVDERRSVQHFHFAPSSQSSDVTGFKAAPVGFPTKHTSKRTEFTLTTRAATSKGTGLIPLVLFVSCGFKNRNISKHETWMKGWGSLHHPHW